MAGRQLSSLHLGKTKSILCLDPDLIKVTISFK